MRMALIVFVVVMLGAGAFLVITKAEQSRSELSDYGGVPDMPFATTAGGMLPDDWYAGKVTVLDFMFTRCAGPCPIMSSHMKELYHLYQHYPEIQFLSITVDPEFDSIPVLHDFGRAKGVNDNRWQFLHGEIDQIVAVSEQGFHLAAEDLPGMHSTKFVLIDSQGRIRGYYSGTDPSSINVLKTHIKALYRQL